MREREGEGGRGVEGREGEGEGGRERVEEEGGRKEKEEGREGGRGSLTYTHILTIYVTYHSFCRLKKKSSIASRSVTT